KQIADGFICNEPVKLISDKNSAVVGAKASGDDYELPFVPTETNHEWNNGVVTTAPTCTTPGVKTYTCKLNPAHTYTEEIPATGHTAAPAVTENEVAATCETVGSYNSVVYCSVCHAKLSEETVTVPALGHDWNEWVCVKEPTEAQAGEEQRTCKNDPSHKETREIPVLSPSAVELSFYDNEVIIVIPDGAIPEGAKFDVCKIVPPPAEVTQKVKEQTGSATEVLAYYEIRLYDADNALITHLPGEITIKTKMPEQRVGSSKVKIIQEDESGKLILMKSHWENEYICFNTDWLEIYN
ncbi:MAG: hypothetical protein IK086_00930, partial [Clostridia bacterium]|nr:hypothetical protein [Clostridia bacterium]